jgi:hypothetical protein
MYKQARETQQRRKTTMTGIDVGFKQEKSRIGNALTRRKIFLNIV